MPASKETEKLIRDLMKSFENEPEEEMMDYLTAQINSVKAEKEDKERKQSLKKDAAQVLVDAAKNYARAADLNGSDAFYTSLETLPETLDKTYKELIRLDGFFDDILKMLEK